jgi:hypothetical protein
MSAKAPAATMSTVTLTQQLLLTRALSFFWKRRLQQALPTEGFAGLMHQIVGSWESPVASVTLDGLLIMVVKLGVKQ